MIQIHDTLYCDRVNGLRMQPVAVTLKLSRSKQDINSEEQEVYLLIGLAVECRSHLWVPTHVRTTFFFVLTGESTNSRSGNGVQSITLYNVHLNR